MTKPKPKRSTTKRPPKAISTEELASILAYASLHDDKAASEKFRVSVRTLQRARASIREGKAPELAALVADQKAETEKRCRDLLVDTYEKGLRALGRRIEAMGKDRMGDRDLVGAIHILGNQRMTRDALGGDEGDSEHEPASGAGPGRTAQETPGAQASPAGSGGAASVAGAPKPVHH